MIFYFTSTGNCLAAAQRIADKTGDRIMSIAEVMKNQTYSFDFGENEKIGIIFPVYFWSTPLIIDEFISKLDVKDFDNKYIYVIATYGGSAGNALGDTYKLFDEKQIKVNAGFKVKMPDNYMITFKAPTESQAKTMLEKSDIDIDVIIGEIEKSSNNKHPNASEKAVSLPSKLLHKSYLKHRETEKFYIDGKCSGCGLCEKICPNNVIKVTDKNPVWNGECIQCLGCLNRCPKEVIQYGKSTKKHGRYIHPYAFKNK